MSKDEKKNNKKNSIPDEEVNAKEADANTEVTAKEPDSNTAESNECHTVPEDVSITRSSLGLWIRSGIVCSPIPALTNMC